MELAGEMEHSSENQNTTENGALVAINVESPPDKTDREGELYASVKQPFEKDADHKNDSEIQPEHTGEQTGETLLGEQEVRCDDHHSQQADDQ